MKMADCYSTNEDVTKSDLHSYWKKYLSMNMAACGGKEDGTKSEQVIAYSCNFCSKSLSCLGDLNKHERSHTREKP